MTEWRRPSAGAVRLTMTVLVLMTGGLLGIGSGEFTLDDFGNCLSERESAHCSVVYFDCSDVDQSNT